MSGWIVLFKQTFTHTFFPFVDLLPADFSSPADYSSPRRTDRPLCCRSSLCAHGCCTEPPFCPPEGKRGLCLYSPALPPCKHTVIKLLWYWNKSCLLIVPENSRLSVRGNPWGWSLGSRPVCLDSQTGPQCRSEPPVARCHGKDLTAACKCRVPSQKCAVGCCACPLKAKRKKMKRTEKVRCWCQRKADCHLK